MAARQRGGFNPPPGRPISQSGRSVSPARATSPDRSTDDEDALHSTFTISRDKTRESNFQTQQLIAAGQSQVPQRHSLRPMTSGEFTGMEPPEHEGGMPYSDDEAPPPRRTTYANGIHAVHSSRFALQPEPSKHYQSRPSKSKTQPQRLEAEQEGLPKTKDATSTVSPQTCSTEDKKNRSDDLVWEVVYRINNQHLYLAQPYYSVDHNGVSLLQGDLGLTSLARHLARKPNIAFVVFQDYYTVDYLDQASRARRNGPGYTPMGPGMGMPGGGPFVSTPPRSTQPSPWINETVGEAEDIETPPIYFESIEPVTKGMREALKALLSSKSVSFIRQSLTNPQKELEAPYFFWYFLRDQQDAIRELAEKHQSHLRLLGKYIESAFGNTYRHVDDLLKLGKIQLKYLPFLIRPDEVLVTTTRSYVRGYIASAMVQMGKPPERRQMPGVPPPAMQENTFFYEVQCWCWIYSGSYFASRDVTLRLTNELDGNTLMDEEIEIRTLLVYPLRFAEEGVKEHLEAVGNFCWSSRVRKLVAYFDGHEAERFMIDTATYQKLHPGGMLRRDPGCFVLGEDPGPEDNDIYAFPPEVKGFNLRRKAWVDLDVSKIIEVEWDKRAFENLVLSDVKTKDLIKALVTTQVAAEKGTDIIKGKGKGLILLLHGAPGTGKTFTAEAVAEITEKPLYRVTCGDIGTSPENVEQYLESVLYLGQMWGCVVLLDEAEVFLEQRGLADLNRNALVSVFLRVLEYYDGILILTSNRVGTFDEAFKSRIQLSIHYDNLNIPQRRKIWRNFLTRLKEIDAESIDSEDIYDSLDEFAKMDLNGRAIRNAITTARQLAKHKNEVVSSSHLQYVIEVASRFDDYIKNVREGMTDEDFARDGGYR
ncbi:hypothetical protein QC761_703490 [Podospora bellae-mahoneyi]|uniref:AAA+ ATPase domain-containing protein n=1 Tax=Podospora bellae-mahoneyi TaxID=2093777 RepID=A0ABR0F4X2_9PEZI|nr:hypothetical protein QC761_703490 [Podospora bellae-mahoneyi]